MPINNSFYIGWVILSSVPWVGILSSGLHACVYNIQPIRGEANKSWEEEEGEGAVTVRKRNDKWQPI